ncbi:hypothetical protein LCGC14_1854750, partial [marine sediment metagenome]
TSPEANDAFSDYFWDAIMHIAHGKQDGVKVYKKRKLLCIVQVAANGYLVHYPGDRSIVYETGWTGDDKRFTPVSNQLRDDILELKED